MSNIKLCSWKGCTEVSAKRNRADYCQEHKAQYNREWRRNNPDKVAATHKNYRLNNEGFIYETPDGYVKYVGFNHPACSPSGMTRYHRIVLWDKLGGQDAPCADCGRQLFWDKSEITSPHDAMCVDHINGIKNDNRPENLDPICLRCNNERARNKTKTKEEESA